MKNEVLVPSVESVFGERFRCGMRVSARCTAAKWRSACDRWCHERRQQLQSFALAWQSKRTYLKRGIATLLYLYLKTVVAFVAVAQVLPFFRFLIFRY